MITVRAVIDEDGCLRSLSVGGHASSDAGGFGSNVVCAAVTGIVRAAAEALSRRATIRAAGTAPAPGTLELEVLARDADDAEWLRGVGDVVLTGVGRIAGDEPDEVELTITRRGEVHGS